MVFKVFCDINVSQITCEKFNENENIYYEIIPKYDDDKENWDPNNSKKNRTETVSLDTLNPTKNEQNDKEQKNEEELKNKENNSCSSSPKDNEIKSNTITKNKEENGLTKESEVSNDTKNENIEETSKSSVEDAIESKEENTGNLKDVETIIKKKEILLGKRQRTPLADITYLFVQEKHTITPKRVKIIKDEPEKVPEPKFIKLEKFVKLEKSSKKANEGSFKSYKVLSENSKENKQPVSKTPLRNISNCFNINVNSNNNIKYSNNSKKLDVPKPFFIDVKKSKTARRTLIPKKSMKSKPNPFNVSARMLR